MIALQEVESMIKESIPGSIVQVSDMTGTLDHLQILVVSDDFKGKLLIDQHQQVMDILKESLKEKIHAVKIKTLTTDKYNEMIKEV